MNQKKMVNINPGVEKLQHRTLNQQKNEDNIKFQNPETLNANYTEKDDTINRSAVPSINHSIYSRKMPSNDFNNEEIVGSNILNDLNDEENYSNNNQKYNVDEPVSRNTGYLTSSCISQSNLTNVDLFNQSKLKHINTKEKSCNLHNDLDIGDINITNFTSIKIIGKGAFGEVRVCKFNLTGEIVAVKLISRGEMLKKNQTKHVLVERDILVLSNSSNSQWIVPLKLAFQDDEYLYLVMDFLPGGDLMSLLMQEECFIEEHAKLYCAELVLGIEAIHNLKAIHRDIKPDNVLIDRDGHVKLSDFGLSRIIVSFLFRVMNFILKTPNYFLKIIKIIILPLKVLLK